MTRKLLQKVTPKVQGGFTIVELLIVIVLIAILAAITIVAYNGIQDRARMSKMQSDLTLLKKAVMAARINTSQTMIQITGSTYTAGGCASQPAGTDLAALAKTDPCWTRYATALSNISTASGININSLVDPWGRPYEIDENEGENGGCTQDTISAYALPLSGGARYSNTLTNIPLGGFSGCT